MSSALLEFPSSPPAATRGHIAFGGNNGDSSGARLHFEVHPTVWQPRTQLDPEPWLDRALEPGEPVPAGEAPREAVRKAKILNMDGMAHEAYIEREALLGYEPAVFLIRSCAEGEVGPRRRPAAKRPAAKAPAKKATKTARKASGNR